MSSIGIFAGTFDPVHNGHLAFAKQAILACKLDKVILIAEKEPYRKQPHAAWDHRQAMIERATETINQVDHDYHFANQLAYQHTMQDMLQIAKRHYGEQYKIWFLVGSDIFEHIKHWHNLAGGHEYGGFIVALRAEHTEEWLRSVLQKHNVDWRVKIIENLKPHASSSTIREHIAAGQHTAELADSVQAYIQNHHLYQ